MRDVLRAGRRWLAATGGVAGRLPFDTAILMYHRFAAQRSANAITRSDFGAQLDYLAATFAVVPLAAALTEPAGKRPRVVITIDDGYRSVHDFAWPELRARGLPATVFVATGFLDGGGWMWQDRNIHLLREAVPGRWPLDWAGVPIRLDTTTRVRLLDTLVRVYRLGCGLDDAGRRDLSAALAALLGSELPDTPPAHYAPMTWEQARTMQDEGCVFGSHTVGHAILPALPAAAVRLELEDSRRELALRLGRTADLFAYPNGDFDPQIRQSVVDAGYSAAVATVPGFWSAWGDLFAAPRIAAPSAGGAALADRLWSYWRRYGAPGPRPDSIDA